MKYSVFSKVLLDTRVVDFEGLKKIGNAFAIKGAIDSNEAFYQDQYYFIHRANVSEEDKKILLAKCEPFPKKHAVNYNLARRSYT